MRILKAISMLLFLIITFPCVAMVAIFDTGNGHTFVENCKDVYGVNDV